MQKTVDMRVQKSLTLLLWHWLPPLVTLALVLALHLDVPYHDQWDLLPLLDAYYQGSLQWQTLLQPHNGHILFLPKLVMLLLAVLTHWNTLAEVLFGFVCMLINWFLLQKMAGTFLARPLSISEKMILSLLVFSLSQAQNWLWGWQLQIPLALLFVLAGFSALFYLKSIWLAFIAASLCGVAASVSFGGSLPFWIAIIPLLWHRQRWLLLPWLIMTSAVLFTYVNTLLLSTDTTINNSTTFADVYQLMDVSELLRHTRNTLALLGNLVARFHMLAATLCGLAATIIISALCCHLPARQKNLALTMVLFSAGSALLVSLSRAGLGDEQMLASRYGTLTLPFWVVTAMLLMNTLSMNNILRGKKTTVWQISNIGLLLCLAASNIYSLQDFQQMHKRLQRGSVALATIDTAQGQHALPVINPRSDQAQALQEVEQLKRYQLSFFRNVQTSENSGL